MVWDGTSCWLLSSDGDRKRRLIGYICVVISHSVINYYSSLITSTAISFKLCIIIYFMIHKFTQSLMICTGRLQFFYFLYIIITFKGIFFCIPSTNYLPVFLI